MLDKYVDNRYLTGEYLVGDDFNLDEITQWYKEEEEAYCELAGENNKEYLYQKINNFYGLRNEIKNLQDKANINILCFGAAWGGEVKGIMQLLNDFKINDAKITIIDSSSEMLDKAKKELGVDTIKANVNGIIDCSDNTFDLITCFGVLHHIPNVSFVFSELIRVLKKDRVLLLREPISSMGNWSSQRIGTTINERGLGVKYIRRLIETNNVNILKLNYLLFSPLTKLMSKVGFDLSNKLIIYIDYLLSKIFSWNINYNRNALLDKFSPGSVFLIIKK